MECRVVGEGKGWGELLGFSREASDVLGVVQSVRTQPKSLGEVATGGDSKQAIRAVAMAEALGYVRVRGGIRLAVVERA